MFFPEVRTRFEVVLQGSVIGALALVTCALTLSSPALADEDCCHCLESRAYCAACEGQPDDCIVSQNCPGGQCATIYGYDCDDIEEPPEWVSSCEVQ